MLWHLFVYRLPSQPSRIRVAVWRELRRLGALPLQNAVVVVPDAEPFASRLTKVAARVRQEGGACDQFVLRGLDDAIAGDLRDRWNELRAQEYREIVEECETKFVKEIEFELFRQNLTASEAEEIEADLDKIKRWMATVQERDLFGTPERLLAEGSIRECERQLEAFVERVYHAEVDGGALTDPPVDIPWGTLETRRTDGF